MFPDSRQSHGLHSNLRVVNVVRATLAIRMGTRRARSARGVLRVRGGQPPWSHGRLVPARDERQDCGRDRGGAPKEIN